MRNNLWIGSGISGRGGIPMLGTGARGLTYLIREIFRNGGQGFAYDPNDLTTLYQDAAGTIPVTAAGQPVGLMLDKSKGLLLGSDLRGTGATIASGGVTAQGDHTYRVVTSGDIQSFTYTSIPIGAVEIDYEILGTPTGSLRIDSSMLTAYVPTTAGRRKVIIYNTRGSVAFVRNVTPTDVTVKVHSVRMVLGNHAYQATSSARSILQQPLILGNELLVNGNFDNNVEGWVSGTSYPSTGEYSDGALKVTPTARYGRQTQMLSLDRNKEYVISGRHWRLSGNSGVYVSLGHGSNSDSLLVTSPSLEQAGVREFSFKFKPVAVLTGVNLSVSDLGTIGMFDNISVREYQGLDDTASYLAFDGIDDKLVTNLPAPLVNATVLRAIPNVGTQVKYNQTLPVLYEDSTNHAGLIAINRALTRTEQLKLMTELDKKAGATSLETLTFKAFDNNQEGFVYDPNDLSTMYQDAVGTVPVAAVGQPVGLVLDKSKGLILGNNVAHITSVIGQGIGGNEFKQVPVTNGLTQGKWYKVTTTVSNYSGSGDLGLTGTNTPFPISAVPTGVRSRGANGKIEFIAYATTTNSITLYKRSSNNADFTDISIQEIKGNHAYQATSASRPILRKNATTGAYYLEFDGVDDFLQINNLAVPNPFTVVMGFAAKYSDTAATKALLASSGVGWLYLVGSNKVASQQITGDPSLNSNRGETDVITYSINGDTAVISTNVESNTSSNLVGKNPYGSVTTITLGSRNVTPTFCTRMDLYGVCVIGKALNSAEESAVRSTFKNKLGM